MTTMQEIKSKKKGTFQHIKVESQNGFLKKGKESNLVKIIDMCVRFGVRRSNIKIVQEINQRNQANGIESNGKTWGTPIDEYFKEHKGNIYLKCFLKKGSKPKVKYLLDNVEVSKEWLIENKYISTTQSNYGEVGDLSINIENITFA